MDKDEIERSVSESKLEDIISLKYIISFYDDKGDKLPFLSTHHGDEEKKNDI